MAAMSDLLYTTPYPDTNAALSRAINRLQAQYGLDLTAVYLLGSLEMDDYVPDWSDIDGLVVLARPAEPLSEEAEAEGVKLHLPVYTLAQLRQPDWRTNPFGMYGMLALMEYGRLLWGTDIRHLLIVPGFPSVRAYMVAEIARVIRERPLDLPVRAPQGVGGPRYQDKSVELVNWLFYPARVLFILETAHVGSKTMAVEHYTRHHFDAWEVWLRWADAYRHLSDRPPLTPKERRQLALAVQDFFWDVVNFILLGLGYDPETLTTDEAVVEALETYLRTA